MNNDGISQHRKQKVWKAQLFMPDVYDPGFSFYPEVIKFYSYQSC